MDNLTFREYYSRFEKAVLQRQGVIRRIEQGGSIATFGQGTRIALMSGLHGDERSGPLGILGWLEETTATPLIPEGYELWIAPLVNDEGWEHGTREWHGQDLNRSFGASAPLFLKSIMASLTETLPCLFLDLHEDSDRPELYVYHHTGDDHGADMELARWLGADLVEWSDFAPWEGSSEIFLRERGCRKSITVEIPPPWPLDKRIECAHRSIQWLTTRLTAFC